MKFAEEIYPKGIFKGQKTDGAYINQHLATNLDVYAKKIADDMHFTIIIAGNDSVGNGKSTIATHTGAYLTWKGNKQHKVNNTFTHKNMVFRANDLVKRSFELPKYSVIVLDEGDDLTEHTMKDTTKQLKKYFRKCRQLNQILILILPMFFELPKFYALGRSHCLINVKFMGEFNRGFFDFYGPKQKKELYLKGKREWNYNATNSDFEGRFFGSYTFFPNPLKEDKLYRQGKFYDMTDDDGEELSTKDQLRNLKVHLVNKFKDAHPDMAIKVLTEMMEIPMATYYDHRKFKKNFEIFESADLRIVESRTNYNKITIGDRDDDDEEEDDDEGHPVPLIAVNNGLEVPKE